jgi:hypothetical protein
MHDIAALSAEMGAYTANSYLKRNLFEGVPMSGATTTTTTTTSEPEKVGVVVIHGVGDAEVGWINDYIVSELERHEPALAFDRFSQVYRLDDKGRGKHKAPKEAPTETRIFRSVMRSATLADRATVSFVELHWADISKVGRTQLANLLDVLKLFFEAPHILGSTVLRHSARDHHVVIRALISFALWTLRWPIAGLQLSIFGGTFVYYVLSKVLLVASFFTARFLWLTQGRSIPDQWKHYSDYMLPLPVPVQVTLALAITAGLGYAFARWRAHRDIGLTSLGLSTAIGSVFLIVLIGLVAVSPFDINQLLRTLSQPIIWAKLMTDEFKVMPDDADKIETYLAVGGAIIIAAWLFWNFAIVIANVLIGLTGIKRYLLPPRRPVVPLRQPASAAALAIVQGILWKLAICPLSIFLILGVSECAGRTTKTPHCMAYAYWGIDGSFGVDNIMLRMVIIAYINVIVAFGIFAMVWFVSKRRSDSLRRQKMSLLSGERDLPRLVISPLILGFILACNITTVLVYYLILGAEHNSLGFNAFDRFSAWFRGHQGFDFLRVIIALPPIVTAVAAPVFGMLQEASRGAIHVARDAVDYHYTPRLAFLARLLPKAARRTGKYPRRDRIQDRLQTLMEEVVIPAGFDRLVFVTHSQGSVIMQDYLRRASSEQTLAGFSRVDILTLASPLSHIYQFYFGSVTAPPPSAEDLHPRLASWTNMWRIDDPLGNRVDIVHDAFVANVPLGAGGHVNYWREDAVCVAILDVIDPARLSSAASAAPVTGQPVQVAQVPPLFPLATSWQARA